MPRRLLSQIESIRRTLPVYGERPRTRGECELGAMPRPCPWAGCRHHLLLEPDGAGVRLNFPSAVDENGDVDLSSMAETCSLDAADKARERSAVDDEPMSYAEIGKLMGSNTQAVRQIEAGALAKLQTGARAFLSASPIADELGDAEGAPDILALSTDRDGYDVLTYE